jgi:hypothetical protein
MIAKIRVPSEVEEKMLGIAQSSSQALREVVRIYVYLEQLEIKLKDRALEFWCIRDCASGWLTSCASLKDGAAIWRLYPTHVYCIAFMAERDEVHLLVLDVSCQAEIETTEARLIGCLV